MLSENCGPVRRSEAACRARAATEEVTRQIVLTKAMRRQRHGESEGARLPAALGQPEVGLVELEERRPDGKSERITPIGWRTARRRLPPILARLDPRDQRLRAAQVFATACERIEASAGAQLQAGTGQNGGASDGGATTRIKHAERLRFLEGVINDWPFDRTARRYIRGPDLVVLAPAQREPGRLPVLAGTLIRSVCLDGLDMTEILSRHGWSDASRNRRKLNAATLDLLDLMAEALGLGGRPSQ